jgi:hypothetical protein
MSCRPSSSTWTAPRALARVDERWSPCFIGTLSVGSVSERGPPADVSLPIRCPSLDQQTERPRPVLEHQTRALITNLSYQGDDPSVYTTTLRCGALPGERAADPRRGVERRGNRRGCGAARAGPCGLEHRAATSPPAATRGQRVDARDGKGVVRALSLRPAVDRGTVVAGRRGDEGARPHHPLPSAWERASQILTTPACPRRVAGRCCVLASAF